MLNSGNMGCRRGDRELSHDAAHSQAIFQQPLRVPGPGLGTAYLSWDLLVSPQRRGNVCPFTPSAQPILSSKRRLVWGGGVGQSYATCPGHREVRFLKP